MAHASGFSIEERIVATLWVHEHPNTGQTTENIMYDFVVRFRKKRYARNDDLRAGVRTAFARVTQLKLKRMNKRTWRRIRLSRDNRGTPIFKTDYNVHFDELLVYLLI